MTSDGGLSAEEVEGHGGEERRDALLVMQMKGHHLSQSFGELGLHELHASIRALHTETRAHRYQKTIPNNKTWAFHYIPLQRKSFKVKQAHLKLLLSRGDCQVSMRMCVCVVCVCVRIHSRVKVSKSVWIN